MNYTIKRDLNEYGPYSLAELQKYVATGNVLLTDLCKSEGMADWVPVSQVIGTIPVPAVAPAAAVAAPYISPYPAPPSLHWGLVLGLGIITCGLFGLVWAFVQAAWVKKVQPESKALILYSIAMALIVFSAVASVGGDSSYQALTGILNLAGSVMMIVAAFSMKASIEQHYTTAEPIGLNLSGVMTFFFNIYYFQYHFTEINEMKNRQFGGQRP